MLDSYLLKLKIIFTKPIQKTFEDSAERARIIAPQQYSLEKMPEEWLAVIDAQQALSADILAVLASQPDVVYIKAGDISFEYLTHGMRAPVTLGINQLNMMDLCCMDSLPAVDNLPEGDHSVYVLCRVNDAYSEPRAFYFIDKTGPLPIITDLSGSLEAFKTSNLYKKFSSESNHFNRLYELPTVDLKEITGCVGHQPPYVVSPLTLDTLRNLQPIVLALTANNGDTTSNYSFSKLRTGLTHKFNAEYDAECKHIREETLSLLTQLAGKTCSLSLADKVTVFTSVNAAGDNLGLVLLETGDQELMLIYLAALARLGDAQAIVAILLQHNALTQGWNIHQRIAACDSTIIRAYLDCINVLQNTDYFYELLSYRQDNDFFSLQIARLSCHEDEEDGFTSLTKKHLSQLANITDEQGFEFVLYLLSNIDGNHLGQVLAVNEDADGLEEYFDLLEKLLSSQNGPEKLKKLLAHKNLQGDTFLHVLNQYQAYRCNIMARQFNVLMALSEALRKEDTLYGVKYHDVRLLDCLAITDRQGFTVGHLIAQRNNPDDIKRYLRILSFIKDADLLVLFFQITNVLGADPGDNLGHLLAESVNKHHDVSIIRDYLSLLSTIENLPELEVLLRQLNRDGAPLGVMVSYDAMSLCDYFDLIVRFEDTAVFKGLFLQETQVPDKYHHAKSHMNNHGLSFSLSIARCKDPRGLPGFIFHVLKKLNNPEILLEFLNKQTASGDSFLTLLAKHQCGEDICAVISRLVELVGVKEFLKLVHEMNRINENFILILIGKHHYTRVNFFLDSIFKEELFADVVSFLMTTEFDHGCFSLVDLVAQNSDAMRTGVFLEEVLFKISDFTLLLQYILRVDRNDRPLMHQLVSPKVAHSQKDLPQSVGNVWSFLEKILNAVDTFEHLVQVLSARDKEGNTILHLLANQDNDALILNIVNLLLMVFKTLTDENFSESDALSEQGELMSDVDIDISDDLNLIEVNVSGSDIGEARFSRVLDQFLNHTNQQGQSFKGLFAVKHRLQLVKTEEGIYGLTNASFSIEVLVDVPNKVALGSLSTFSGSTGSTDSVTDGAALQKSVMLMSNEKINSLK